MPPETSLDNEVESLGGLHHPHALEVQDFSSYALVIDLRSRAEYEADHLPRAVRVSLDEVLPLRVQDVGPAGQLSTVLYLREVRSVDDLPDALTTLVATLQRDEAILVYCGRGGQESAPIARALRWQGRLVDVLPGGWINYRHWVQVGLEVLPGLVDFRLLPEPVGTDASALLQQLRAQGEQVLDIGALVQPAPGAEAAMLGAADLVATQAPQALFDSKLLHALRQMDPRRPVWVGGHTSQLGGYALPGSLKQALAGRHGRDA